MTPSRVARTSLVVIALTSALSLAQSSTSNGLDLQRYAPGPGVNDVLSTMSARTGGHLRWQAGVSLDYAHAPLALYNSATGEKVQDVVGNQTTLNVMGALGITRYLELGVALPIVFQPNSSGNLGVPVTATGLGDLRVTPKVMLFGNENVALGIGATVQMPTAGGSSFRGSSGFGVLPRAMLEVRGGIVRWLVDAGVNFKPTQTLLNVTAGNEFAFATALEFNLSKQWALQATGFGALGLQASQSEEFALEALAAVQFKPVEIFAIRLGGGPGLSRGFGTPTFRLLLTAAFTAPEGKDTDGDGIDDKLDQCISEPEDKDGFQDADGCPDIDDDQDGVIDRDDQCKTEKETKNGYQDEDGCPDQVPDADGDGIVDAKDACPKDPEDKDGFEDEDGCPDLDDDADGIPDTVDQCKTEKEIYNKFKDEDGCADTVPDTDKDGFTDDVDQCPNEPETFNGNKDDDGCPDEGKSKVVIVGSNIKILEKVFFATGKDAVLERSFGLLRQVAAVLKAHQELKHVRVEGHTDNVGKPEKNLDLSQRRAANVRSFLIKEGIDGERLQAVGYGQEKPVDNNKTASGRENNRRVEFVILEQ